MVSIRPVSPADTDICGRIMFAAFDSIASHHGFAADFPSPEAATGVASMLIGHSQFFGVVAEDQGRIVGSNFIDFRSSIAGIGPVSVDPERQNSGIGGRLMQAVMDEAVRRNSAGMRLVQLAYHNRSLCLYSKLGFQTRDPLSIMQGRPLAAKFAGYEVRPLSEADVEPCERLCRRVLGMSRAVELREAIAQQSGYGGRAFG